MQQPTKQRRKRRTKAEIEEDRVKEQQKHYDVLLEVDGVTLPSPKSSYSFVYQFALDKFKGSAEKASEYCKGWFSVKKEGNG